MRGGLIARLALSILAALVAMIVTALVVTIADLYLVGHGHDSINREILSWSGVSLSLADVLLLTAGLAAWWVTWFLLRPRPGSPAH